MLLRAIAYQHNFVRSSICQYQWCWLCGETYHRLHYAPFNIFGCPALQNGSYNVQNTNQARIYFVRALSLLGILVILPLLLAFIGPIILISSYREVFRRQNTQTWKLVIIYFVLFVLGIALEPIIWAIFAIMIVPFLCFLVYSSYAEKRRISQVSQQEIDRRQLLQQAV